MCGRKSPWWLLALLLLVLFFSARTIWADETSAPATPPPLLLPNQSLPMSDTTPTDPWSSFDQAWSSLKNELTGSQTDLETLSSLLQNLRIEADELRFSLQASTRLYEQSEVARMTERRAAIDREAGIVERLWAAERSRGAWRVVAIVAGSLAVASAGLVALAIAF